MNNNSKDAEGIEVHGFRERFNCRNVGGTSRECVVILLPLTDVAKHQLEFYRGSNSIELAQLDANNVHTC